MSTILQKLQVKLSPQESPDWGYARNLRAILKRPLAEWSSSLSSVQLSLETPYGDSKSIVPNRDFPYEGLFGIVGRENWKFLDGLPAGIYFKGKWLEIKQSHVIVTPWKCLYEYVFMLSDQACKLQAEYYLLSMLKKCALRVCFRIDLSDITEGSGFLSIDPIIDIRHMYGASIPTEHEVSLREHIGRSRVLEVCKDQKYLFLLLDSDIALFTKYQRVLPWSYKLGRGERVDGPKGIHFINEERLMTVPVTVSVPIECGKKEEINTFIYWSDSCVSNGQLDTILNNHIDDERSELKNIERVMSSFRIWTGNGNLDRAIASRILSLTKFGVSMKDPNSGKSTIFPEAGAWWFRTVWFRDVYEGLLNNIRTFLSIPGGQEFIRRIINASISLLDLNSGRIPNRLPEFEHEFETFDSTKPLPIKYYNSSDATLLFILLASRFAHETGDRSLAAKIVDVTLRVIAAYAEGEEDQIDGRPVLSRDTGLLLTVPSHSWADSHEDVRIGDIIVPDFPLRVPIAWASSQDNPHKIYEETHRPKYYLPEINALWIKTLKAVIKLLREDLVDVTHDDQRKRCIEELELRLISARSTFKKVFWNDVKGFLYSIVTNDFQKKDETETSFAVVSASLLDDLFSHEELSRIWNVTRNTLLVLRKPQEFKLGGMRPFGILAKNSANRIFYNDRQYHEAVVWSRDTPYLVHMLRRLGKIDTIRDILINHIDHQMTECAIFFCSELFSLPEGKNPSPSSTSSNPIPIKNPAQWWSHWTDLFLSFFAT